MKYLQPCKVAKHRNLRELSEYEYLSSVIYLQHKEISSLKRRYFLRRRLIMRLRKAKLL